MSRKKADPKIKKAGVTKLPEGSYPRQFMSEPRKPKGIGSRYPGQNTPVGKQKGQMIYVGSASRKK